MKIQRRFKIDEVSVNTRLKVLQNKQVVRIFLNDIKNSFISEQSSFHITGPQMLKA